MPTYMHICMHQALGMLTMLIAATERAFHFKDLAEPINLRAGDVLVFNSLLCHKGAEHAADAEQASVAAHAYCGNELEDLGTTYDCLTLDGEVSSVR